MRVEEQRLLLEVALDDDRIRVRTQRREELAAHLQRRTSVRRRLLELRQLAGKRDELVPADHGSVPSGVIRARYAARERGFDARSQTEPAGPEKYAMNSMR